MDDLNTIEAAIKSTCNSVATGPGWFDQYWKPKFDRVRTLLIPDHYKKVFEALQETERYD